MTYALGWLPDVLLAAGLKVAEVPGWETRGHGDMKQPRGVMCHHTAGPAEGIMPSLRLVTDGRPDLPGPLSQLCLGRDGTYFLVAAGRAYHAGQGNWHGLTAGNSRFIGIEAEHTGRPGETWPTVQMEAYVRGAAAILTRLGAGPGMCCGHGEYALPTGRKTDPRFGMAAFRRAVGEVMAGSAPAAPLIPVNDNKGRPTLRRGATGELVLAIQRAVGVVADGTFGPLTEAAVRAFQRLRGLVPDGIVGPLTWAAIGQGRVRSASGP
jgi:hypothetical protein